MVPDEKNLTKTCIEDPEAILYPVLRVFLPAGLGGSSAVEASSGWPTHQRNSSRPSLQPRIYTHTKS